MCTYAVFSCGPAWPDEQEAHKLAVAVAVALVLAAVRQLAEPAAERRALEPVAAVVR